MKINKTEIEFEKWYHVRVVITSTDTTDGKNVLTWEFYLDDIMIGSGTNSKNYVTDSVLGFRIKCKDISYFSEGGITFANTVVTEYEIAH